MKSAFATSGRTLAYAALAATLTGCAGTPAGQEGSPEIPTLSKPSSVGPAGPTDTQDSVEAYLTKQQAFVDCIRASGYPEMQDPDEFGLIVLGDLIDIPRPVLARVKQTCEPLIEGNDMPGELQDRLEAIEASQMTPDQKQEEIEFSTCMQENGASNYPDPQPNGLPREPDWETMGSTVPTPPGLLRAREACLPLRGGGPEEGTE